MSRKGSILAAMLGAAALALGSSSPGSAQVGTAVDVARNLSVEGRAGMGIPAGDLANVEDPGFTAGLGVSYRVANRLRIRADGDLETLLGALPTGASATYDDLKLWHYGAGLELELLQPIIVPWRISAGVGAGATTWKFDQSSSKKTYFTTSGFVRGAYHPNPMVDLFVQARAYLMFTSSQDFASLGQPSPIGDKAWSFPLTGGVAIHLP
jgi:hypothetical protein